MKKINTALASFGMSGKLFHAPFLHVHPGFVLSGAWERSKKNIEMAYPGAISYISYDAILNDENIELVIVNTPSVTHYDLAKKALLAGKHVVVEKPFVARVSEGEELIKIAKEKELVLSVYQNRRFDADFLIVKEILDEKRLGDIIEAEIHYDRFVESLSYKVHKETPELGTGALYDLGSHLIDQALQFFGKPTAVFGDITIMRPISKVCDYFEIILYYPTFRVRLHCSYLVREATIGYLLHGNKGSFIKSKTNRQEEDLDAGKLPIGDDWGKENESEYGLLHTEENGKIIREKIMSKQGNYMKYYDGIYDAIRLEKSVPVRAEDGLEIIKIIEAAMKSNDEKRIIPY